MDNNESIVEKAIKSIIDVVQYTGYENLEVNKRIELNYLLESLFGKSIDRIMNNYSIEQVCSGDFNNNITELSNIIDAYLDFKKFNIEHGFFTKKLEEILNNQYDAIVIFKANFGWNIEMKQRPQHIAEQLAKQNILYLYIASDVQDKTYSIENIGENLYLINMARYTFNLALFEILSKVKIPKFLHVYATCLYSVTYDDIKEYMDKGFKVLYDFVDEISEELSKASISKEIINQHKKLLNDKENVIVLSTATNLYNDVTAIRGNENSIMCPNGVNIEDFRKEKYEEPDAMKKIREKGNPVIGYYGALASWFDYEMVEYLAKSRPNYEIVLIGWKYDNSYGKTNMDKYENIHYLGIVDYPHLANHSKYFDVATIPFLLNDVTKATSPVKLFEYMAVGNPIVTTDLEECRKYESCLIAKDKEDFVKKIDYCIDVLSNDEKYKKILAKEAEENTWSQRAQDIKDAMMKAVK